MFALDIFHGQVSATTAHIYVRIAGDQDLDCWTIRGKLYGPRSHYGRMLPAKIPLADLGPGQTMLAGAVLPDPCIWSPAMPALYEATVELHRTGNSAAADSAARAADVDSVVIQQSFGIRALGTRGRGIFRLGQRWVPRGIDGKYAKFTDLSEWRDAGAVMVTPDPDDDLCRDASIAGAFLVAVVDGASADLPETLSRLSRWAAVGMIVIRGETQIADKISLAVPNVLLATAWSDQRPVPGWADLVVCDERSLRKAMVDRRLAERPLVAVRRPQQLELLSAVREVCARLQRATAPIHDFAGYLVSDVLND